MANSLTTTDQAPGVQAISRLARQPQAWTTDAAAIELAGPDPISAITAARDDLMTAFAIVPPETSLAHVEWRVALASRLNKLAGKIAPTMPEKQAEVWREAMIDALADLPAMIGLTAAKRAMHEPMQFISEVETVIRKIADEITTSRRDAIRRLEFLLASLAAASQPALPPPPPEPTASPDDLAALMRKASDPGLKSILLTAAIGAGWQPPTDEMAEAA